MCWLRVVLHAMRWPRRARGELGKWLIEHGRHEGDDFLVGAGEAIRDYETPPFIAHVRERLA